MLSIASALSTLFAVLDNTVQSVLIVRVRADHSVGIIAFQNRAAYSLAVFDSNFQYIHLENFDRESSAHAR